MKVLIDTNILIDALTAREPFFSCADALIKMCADKKLDGYMAAHSIPNLFYILRHEWSIEDRKKVLLHLCRILKVEGIDYTKIVSGLENENFTDFEDCLQYECAAAIGADYIITRNADDFAKCDIPCLTAEEILRILE